MISSADTEGPAASSTRWPLPLAARAGPVTVLSTPLNRSRTSADAEGLRASLPLLMTSSIFSPRRLLALCSPITHVMASATLLLPQPLGPTMAVTPLSKASSERSENDLKPLISRRSRRMEYSWLIADLGMRIGRGVNPQSAFRDSQYDGEGLGLV